MWVWAHIHNSTHVEARGQHRVSVLTFYIVWDRISDLLIHMAGWLIRKLPGLPLSPHPIYCRKPGIHRMLGLGHPILVLSFACKFFTHWVPALLYSYNLLYSLYIFYVFKLIKHKSLLSVQKTTITRPRAHSSPTTSSYVHMEFLVSCRTQISHTNDYRFEILVSLFYKLFVVVLVPLVFEVYRPSRNLICKHSRIGWSIYCV